MPDYYFYDLNASYTSYRGGGATRLTFYRGRDQVTVDADVNTDLVLGWGNTVAMLRHERFLGDNLEGRLTLSHSRYESLTDAEILATEFDVVNELKDTTLSAQLDWRAGQRHRLVGGLAYAWYDFGYRQDFNRNRQIDYGARPRELAAFVEDRWFLDDLSTVRGGLRYRHLSDGRRSLWEPRLSLSRQVQPDLRLKLGGGLYNQYLQLVSTEGFSAGDFYLPIDETADPGRSWQARGRRRLAARRSATSSACEVYYTDLPTWSIFDNTVPVDQSSFDGRGPLHDRRARAMPAESNSSCAAARGLAHRLGGVHPGLDPPPASRNSTGARVFAPKYDRRHDINCGHALSGAAPGVRRQLRATAPGQAFTPASARYGVRQSGHRAVSTTMARSCSRPTQQRPAAALSPPRRERETAPRSGVRPRRVRRSRSSTSTTVATSGSSSTITENTE